MSDFHDTLYEVTDEQHGFNDLVGNMVGISQRHNQLAAQKKQLEALKEQAKIDKSRAHIENQRLEIEKKRLAAEEAEREYRHQQDEQIKQLRNLLADSLSDLDILAKKFPA